MNGRIAKLTLPRLIRTSNLRTLLLTGCCVMSLALLGAVRLAPQFRPEPLLALSQPPIAEWNDTPDQLTERANDDVLPGPLNTQPPSPLASAALPANVKLLRATVKPAPITAPPVTEAIVPAPLLPPATPTLVGPRTRTLLMEVTAYCPCPRCCGPRAQGITASGRRVSYNGGRFVAADTRVLKFNTKLRIPGYAGETPVEVIDRGGAIKGHKLDVYFPTHQEARKWGRQMLYVTVVD